MALKTQLIPHTLKFRFDAGTSRGVLSEKTTYLLKVWDHRDGSLAGWGECGPLSQLSIDDHSDLEGRISRILKKLDGTELPENDGDIWELAFDLAGHEYPALRFALEVALTDLKNGGGRKLFDNGFYNGGKRIPINGLIWMGDPEVMRSRISQKLDQGFDCLKMKVGALDFDREVSILEDIRKDTRGQDITLRVDANGAFDAGEALRKMEILAKVRLHSIEQPIRAGNREQMARLCKNPPVAVALDEELIGIREYKEKEELLEKIDPQYIIIKPTLLGGMKASIEWMELANKRKTGWWITSALESNIGLNAICQLAEEVSAAGHQGLGTGQLYENNIGSPLTIEKGYIFYDNAKSWDYSSLTLHG